MEEDWETLADDPAPVVIPPKAVNANKWEGEDAEEDVKDSWEDDDEEVTQGEEKKDAEKAKETSKIKPKKLIADKIAKKERQLEEEREAKEQERLAAMTPEEKSAEKLRIQKIQEEADLRVAMDTFGVTDSDLVRGELDGAQPTNPEEFSQFKTALVKKISQFKAIEGFPGFIEELVQGVCLNLSASDMQKIKKTIDNLYTEKQKLEKEKSKKSNAKGKGKASLRLEQTGANIQAFDSYDYDDFM